METLMISAFGRYVAVGLAGVGCDSCVLPGFGMSKKAMLDGAGVAGAVQLENKKAHRMMMK